MNREKIAHAIHEAISCGVAGNPSRPLTNLQSDVTVVTHATSISLRNPDAFRRFTEILAADPTFEALSAQMMSMGLVGGALRVGLERIAHALLAQSLTRGVEPVVEEVAEFLKKNEAECLVIMALAGIQVSGEVPLGPTVKLVPVLSLPASTARGNALGQPDAVVVARAPIAASAALVMRASVAPIFGTSEELAAPKLGKSDSFLQCNAMLEEARNCLSLVGSCAPLVVSIWTHFLGPAEYLAGTAGWLIGEPLPLFVTNVNVDAKEAEQLGATYFAWPDADRKRALHVPLSRLARAIRQHTDVDRAIDLGIALEALLLHDVEAGGELSYRLAFRGAWLGGHDIDSRTELFDLLRGLYDLRSRAVHRGFLEAQSPQGGKRVDTRAILANGTEVCGQLIRSAIERGEIIRDWRRIVLGG